MFRLCPERGITEVELRALRDSAEHSGAREVHIISKRFNYNERKLDELYHLLIKVSRKSTKKRSKLLPENGIIELLK